MWHFHRMPAPTSPRKKSLMPSTPLRRRLRGLGHALTPVVQIGKLGASDAVAKQVNQALLDHELVKVKFIGFKDEKDDLARQVVTKIDATLVRVVGNIAIYYRHQPDPEKRVVHLPK